MIGQSFGKSPSSAADTLITVADEITAVIADAGVQAVLRHAPAPSVVVLDAHADGLIDPVGVGHHGLLKAVASFRLSPAEVTRSHTYPTAVVLLASAQGRYRSVLSMLGSEAADRPMEELNS